MGLFGATNPAGPDWLREQIKIARDMSGDRPYGVGFISHLVPVFPELLDVALSEGVPIVAFSFSDPSPWVARVKEAGATAICQIQKVEDAKIAVEAGADILVVQGNEAGGHTGRANLMPLLARVVDEYPNVPVMAAGGIASGRSLAAVLAAGADGAWLGTRLLATHECDEVSSDYKQMLVSARSEDTVHTQVFDFLDEASFGIPPWPQGIAGRAVLNHFLRERHGREEDLRSKLGEIQPLYGQALTENDVSRTAIWAGESVDGIDSVRGVSDVIHEICNDAQQLLESLRG